MAFKIRCPECGTTLLATDDAVGHDIRCAACDAVFPVPEPSHRAHSDDSYPLERDEERSEPDRSDDDTGDRDRDDYERRRPARRRRRRPPPSGRGPLFWIAVVGGVMALAVCGCCGGGYLLMPGEQWRTYRSPGGYSVEIPIKPDPDLRIPGVKHEPGVHTEGGVFWKRGECYVMLYIDSPPRELRVQSDEELLREAVREMTADPDVKRVVREAPVTVSGFPGREVEFEGTDGGTYLARVVIADRRAFMVIGGGRFVRPKNANIRRFVDSFQVTDPTLKNGPHPTTGNNDGERGDRSKRAGSVSDRSKASRERQRPE